MTALAAFQFGFWFAAGVFGFGVCLIVVGITLLAFAGYLLKQRG